MISGLGFCIDLKIWGRSRICQTGAPTQREDANLLLGQNLPKTAWKWRKLDQGSARPNFYYVEPPLKTTVLRVIFSCLKSHIDFHSVKISRQLSNWLGQVLEMKTSQVLEMKTVFSVEVLWLAKALQDLSQERSNPKTLAWQSSWGKLEACNLKYQYENPA